MVDRINIRWDRVNGSYKVSVPKWEGGEVVSASDFDELARKCEALERDAARYRWLKPRISGREYRDLDIEYDEPGGVDAAIDAAIDAAGYQAA